MDPLTRAAENFTRQLSLDWRRAPIVRFVAPARDRSHLVRSLRLFEWSPDNRWPLCIVEAAVDDLDALADAARTQLLADLARLRKGLAEDGVVLVDLATVADGGHGLDPMTQLRSFVDRAGVELARTGVVAGVALAFVPAAPPGAKALRRLAAALAAWPERSHVRVGLAVADPTELADVLPVGAAFDLDEAALHDYCREQSERQAAKVPAAEASLRRHLLAASDAARRGDLAAARRAYLAAGSELEAQDKCAEAAVIHIALGGLAFGLGDSSAALEHFGRAVSHGTAANQPGVVSQAHLGAAGVLFAGGELHGASGRYELAASCGGPDALQIEALRMAGTCRLQLGDRDGAARAWQTAVTIASALPGPARGHTTWKQAGEALLAHLQRKGLGAQAEHLRALLQAD